MFSNFESSCQSREKSWNSFFTLNPDFRTSHIIYSTYLNKPRCLLFQSRVWLIDLWILVVIPRNPAQCSELLNQLWLSCGPFHHPPPDRAGGQGDRPHTCHPGERWQVLLQQGCMLYLSLSGSLSLMLEQNRIISALFSSRFENPNNIIHIS